MCLLGDGGFSDSFAMIPMTVLVVDCCGCERDDDESEKQDGCAVGSMN